MDCPLCDGFGVVDDPLAPGRLKRCPECDTPLSAYLLPLSVWLFGPDGPGEDDARERARRADEAAVLAHATTAGPDCRCRWCTVRPAA
jgi:hypothetical protein